MHLGAQAPQILFQLAMCTSCTQIPPVPQNLSGGPIHSGLLLASVSVSSGLWPWTQVAVVSWLLPQPLSSFSLVSNILKLI